MSYKTVDVVVDGEHKLTMSGTDEQINSFIHNYNGNIKLVEWVNGIDPKLPVNNNKNDENIDLMISTDRDENSFYDIARFVDRVRKENPSLKDHEILMTFDYSQCDHEVTTLLVPRKS